MSARAIAIDVGIGQIRAALVSEGQRTLGRISVDGHSLGEDPPVQSTIARIKVVAEEVQNRAGLTWEEIGGIGVSLPGPVNKDGTMGQCGILRSWSYRPVINDMRAAFEEHSHLKVALVNDANSAALGEATFGAGRNIRNVDLVYFVVTAGIGAGIVLNGELYVGVSGNAGEWGHVVVDTDGPDCDGCGRQKGCLEAVGSGTAIARQAVEMFKLGKLRSVQATVLERGPLGTSISVAAPTDSGGFAVFSLPNIGGNRPFAVWARDVMQAAAAGDADAKQILRDAGTAMGKAVVQACHIINPSKVVIGGVVVGSPEYLEAATDWARRHALLAAHVYTVIQPAELPESNSLFGAAAAVFAEIRATSTSPQTASVREHE